jgi:hypothetical protein
MMEANSNRRPAKSRSPSYPAITLERALDRTRIVYKRERRNWAPPEALMEHWGYSPGSSNGLVTIAALKKYGLLDDKGQGGERSLRLSESGLKLAIDEDGDAFEYRELLKDAALKPKIHSDLLSQFPEGLPSDATLRRVLIGELGFTETAVKGFIPTFRETLRFAGVQADGDIIAAESEDLRQEMHTTTLTSTDTQPAPRPTASSPQTNHSADPTMIQFPISPTESVTIRGTSWDKRKLEHVIKLLQALKDSGMFDECEAPNDQGSDIPGVITD